LRIGAFSDRENSLEMFLQVFDDCPGHCRDAVFVSLALADGYLAALEVQVFDPHPERFEQSQTSAIQQHGD
jgi:hypothetical protein